MLRIVGVLLTLSMWQIAATNAEQQMFITHPSTMIRGNRFAVDLVFEPYNEQVTTYTVSLNSGKGLLFDKATVDLPMSRGQFTERVEFTIPSNVMETSATVKVTSPDASISSYVETIRDPSSTIIIQTDRGKYKPGDTVKFRILNVDSNLLPQHNVVEVTIQDPNKYILWKSVPNPEDQQRSIIDGSLTLIDEAPLGDYKITMVLVGITKKEEYFKVEKYDLPKFETQITLDTALIARTPSMAKIPVTGQVQAYYTNGQFVEGTMRLKINREEMIVDQNFDGSEPFNLLMDLPQLDTNQVLKVLAIVEERFTGNSANMSASQTVLPHPFAAEPVTPIPYYIQGTDYHFSVKLINAAGGNLNDWDASGASGNINNYRLFYEYQLSGRTVTKNIAVTENPVSVTIPTQTGLYLSSGSLKVWFDYQPSDVTEQETLMSSKVEVQFRTADSFSGDFIHVELYSYGEENEACFRIDPFEETETAYYQVVGNKGQSAIEKYTSAEGKCITLTDEHSPKFEVIAYKIQQYEDDSEEMKKEVLVNAAIGDYDLPTVDTVSLSVNPTLVKPGGMVTLELKSSVSGTLVGLRGVDKSSQLLAKAYDVSQAVVNNVRSLDRMFDPVNSGQDSGDLPFRSYIDPTVTPGNILKDAGLTLARTSKLFFKYYGDAFLVFDDDRAFHQDLDANAGAGMPEMADGDANRQNELAESAPDMTVTDAEEDQVRKDFRETWLWSLNTIGFGTTHLTMTVPDTITSWVIDSFTLHPRYGLSVIPTQEITVTQDLFMSMNLPYSLIRGEKFTLQILVFNYKDIDVTVDIELKNSLEFIITDLSKRTARLEITPQSSQVLEVPILSNKIGEIKLEASVIDILDSSNSDQVERMLLVESEGRRIDNSSEIRYILPDSAGTVSYDISRQVDIESLVNDSLKVYVQITGDIMGPYMEFSENEIPLPHGCGEQTISSMTPGLFIGKYLKGLNMLDAEMRYMVEKVCNEGYRRELKYRLNNGSFNAFGEGSGNGSTWLTAYVLKVFSIMGEEGFVDIPITEILHSAFDFINSKTVPLPASATHFFVEDGKVIHTEMQGGAVNMKTDRTTNTIKNMYAFSTFIIISLQDYYEYLLTLTNKDYAKMMAVEDLLQKSSDWLAERAENSAAELSNYSRLIMAYALARSGMVLNNSSYLTLSQNLLNDGTEEMRDCTEARNPNKQIKPLDVEMHGYELLAYVTLAKKMDPQLMKEKIDEYCLVDWLVNRRKSNGFFYSTQDTSVALQALTEYALVFPEDSEIDFSVRIIAGDETVQVNNENSYLLNQVKVDMAQIGENMELQMELAGNGTAIIAIRTIYYSSKNVTESPLIITIDKRVTQDEHPYIRCGVSVLPRENEDEEELSSMVLLRLKLPTCTRADSVVSASNEYSIDRVEYEDDKQTVTAYFMTNSGETATFAPKVDVFYEQICDIVNPQPGVATAFDYYNPGNNNQILYTTLTQRAVRDPERPTEGASALTVNFMLLTLTLFLYRALY